MNVAEGIRYQINHTARALHLNHPLASPSLWKPNQGTDQATPTKTGSFEIKFVVEDALAEQLVATVAARMQLDPHADPQTRGYSVEGIYFETDEFDVFKRTPGYSRRKFRVRKYGGGDNLFIERKSKRRGIVTKRRYQLTWNELPLVLSHSLAGETQETPPAVIQPEVTTNSELSWFANRIQRLKLKPTLCIAYERIAFLQLEGDCPIRLTIDRGLSCCRFVHRSFPDKPYYSQFLDGKCIVELKYRETMPGTFREWIDEFRLISQPVSKFRNAILATALVEQEGIQPKMGAD